MFSSRSFKVSGLTLRSLIHLEFIFVYGVRKCSSFILLQVVDQFSQQHLLKRLSFFHCMWVRGFISGLSILFHWSIFHPAMFIIAKTWKQHRCPSVDEWIKKLWYIYTMEYYSAIKSNSLESVLMRWVKLEPIIQSEVSQKGKDHYIILTHIYGI